MSTELTAAQLVWMKELNREAIRRGCDPARWPSASIETGPTCWLEDYEAGLTPAQALDANGDT